MTVQFDDWLRWHVRVPHKYLKVKSTTYYNLVLLTVGNVSDRSLMATISTSKSPDGNNWMVVQNLIVERRVFEVLLHHILVLLAFFI